MLSITLDQWIDLQELLLDDFAGPIDTPEFDVEIVDQVILTFESQESETWFRLKYLK